MFKTMFAMFLIFHVLGDFYAQPEKLAAGKREKYGYVLLHGGIYTIVFFAAACLTWLFRAVWFAAALSLAHFLIDSLKHIMRKSVEKRGKGDIFLYLADQLLHLASFAAAAAAAVYIKFPAQDLFLAGFFRDILSLEPGIAVRWAGILLLICKPANITVKRILAPYKPREQTGVFKNAGALIGSLERILIVILVGAGQFAAIGFVLTAKSVARYEKLKEQDFAEYYLLGTLLSTLNAIAVYYLFI